MSGIILSSVGNTYGAATIPNLIAYYPLTTSATAYPLYPNSQTSDTGNLTFNTSSGFGITAPPTGTGRCAFKSGSLGAALLGYYSASASITELTMEWWMYVPNASGDAGGGQVSAGIDSFGTQSYTKTQPWYPNGSPGASNWSSGGYYYNSNLAISNGTWYCMCVTVNQSQSKIYLNGVLKDTENSGSWTGAKAIWYRFFANSWSVYATELRIFNNVKYTGNYTPNPTPLY